MGVAWASGLNLYAAIFMLGMLGATGNMVLPPGLEVLNNPLVIGAAGFMYVVEFVADKIPGVDTGWDTIHTFIRIPAGALLAAEAVGEVEPAVALAAGLLGAGIAGTSHVAKAGSRILINASPEPFSNSVASVTEDVAVFAGIWTALNHPWVFLSLLVVFLVLVAWLLPKLLRGIRTLFSRIGALFGKRPVGVDEAGGPPPPS